MPLGFRYFPIVIVLILLFVGCKKKEVAEEPFQNMMAIEGDFYNFSELKFAVYTQYTPQKIKWEFGDTTTSTALAPTKKYDRIGTFTVKVAINGDTLHKLEKTITIKPKYNISDKVRNWKISFRYEGYEDRISTNLDTQESFSVTMLNDKLMMIPATPFNTHGTSFVVKPTISFKNAITIPFQNENDTTLFYDWGDPMFHNETLIFYKQSGKIKILRYETSPLSHGGVDYRSYMTCTEI